MRPVLIHPYDFDAVLAFHRAQFGALRMEGDDDKPDDKSDDDRPDDKPDLDADLSDAGKKALREERARAAKAERAAKDAARERDAHRAELEKLRGDSKSENEKAVEAARKEASEAATKEATDKANRRILTAEVKAAAGTKLADPNDAVRLLDLTEFEVDDDGNVDDKAIKDAIDALLKDKPYLAADDGKKFKGGADQGARDKDTKRATSIEDAVGAHYTSR
jgi:hypothetical protein